jgi:hypothetical protein
MVQQSITFFYDETRIQVWCFPGITPTKRGMKCRTYGRMKSPDRCDIYGRFQEKNRCFTAMESFFYIPLKKINICQYILSVYGYPGYKN